jgi:hypothetical protein
LAKDEKSGLGLTFLKTQNKECSKNKINNESRKLEKKKRASVHLWGKYNQLNKAKENQKKTIFSKESFVRKIMSNDIAKYN